jgi:hypothetical protein
MSGLMSTNPCVVVKRKHMQDVMEYCLDQRLSIRCLPRGTGDEWELEFFPENHVQAVALGMFLREQKLELLGFGSPAISPPPKTKPKRLEKKSTSPSPVEKQSEPNPEPVQEPVNVAVPNQVDSADQPVGVGNSDFQLESTPTIEGKPAGFGLFEGDNEEAPFS